MAKEAVTMSKKSKATQRVGGGLLIKVIILVLLVAVGFQLFNLRKQVLAAEAEKEHYAQQVQKTKAENDALESDIAEGNTLEKIEEIAREELGWAYSDEYIFDVKRN